MNKGSIDSRRREDGGPGTGEGDSLVEEAVKTINMNGRLFNMAMENAAPKRREELEGYVMISKEFERGMEVA